MRREYGRDRLLYTAGRSCQESTPEIPTAPVIQRIRACCSIISALVSERFPVFTSCCPDVISVAVAVPFPFFSSKSPIFAERPDIALVVVFCHT